MRILGIDPGLATVGIGLIESVTIGDLRVIDWCTIQTRSGLLLADRLCEIQKDLEEILANFTPDLAVIERLFFATNARTAIDVAHARGVILSSVGARGIPIVEPTPLQLKLAITGDGKADKRQVQMMLLHLLKLSDLPRPDDAADALALAVYGSLQSGVLMPEPARRP